MKETFSVKLQTDSLCLCLIWKLNKTQAAQIRNIMQSSSTFIRMSGPIPEVKKKICIDKWLGKCYCILERIQANRGVSEQVRFVPNIVGGSGEKRYPSKNYPNNLTNYKIKGIFLWNWKNLKVQPNTNNQKSQF